MHPILNEGLILYVANPMARDASVLHQAGPTASIRAQNQPDISKNASYHKLSLLQKLPVSSLPARNEESKGLPSELPASISFISKHLEIM